MSPGITGGKNKFLDDHVIICRPRFIDKVKCPACINGYIEEQVDVDKFRSSMCGVCLGSSEVSKHVADEYIRMHPEAGD